MFSFWFSISLTTLALLYAIQGAAVPPVSISQSKSLVLGKNSRSSEKVSSEKCQCVYIVLCEPQNVIVRSNTNDDSKQNQCPDTYVCCTSPLPQDNSTTFSLDSNERIEEIATTQRIIEESSPIPLLVEPSSSCNNTDTFSHRLSDDDEPEEEFKCECVAFFECATDDIIDLPTPRFNECPNGKVCCKTSKSTPPLVSQPIEPSLPNDTKVTHVVFDEDALEILTCQCVPFYECSDDDLVLLPIDYNDEHQCTGEEVCCKMPSYLTSPPILHSTEPIQSNNTKIILYGVTDDDEFKQLECECVAFYVCSSQDQIDLSTTYTNDRCLDSDVCCKISNTSPTISQPAEPPKVIIYGLSEDAEHKELECECILFFQCAAEDVIRLPTTYNIKDQCSTSEVCCKRSKSTPPSSTQPTEPAPTGTPSSTTDVIIYGLKQKELLCECVLFYNCPAEDVIELPTDYNKKDRCSASNVCCRKTDLPSPSLSPPSSPPPKKTKAGPVTLELSLKITWWP